MMSSDKRIIIRLVYSFAWWFSFGAALMTESTGGKYYAFFSAIIYALVLYADARAEHFDDLDKKRRNNIKRKFKAEYDAALKYKPEYSLDYDRKIYDIPMWALK